MGCPYSQTSPQPLHMPQIHQQSSLAIAGAAATIITTVVVATTITNLKLLISLPPFFSNPTDRFQNSYTI